MNHHFFSPKGGQGCSTTAAMMAIQLADLGWRVALVDCTGTDDLRVMLGVHPDMREGARTARAELDLYSVDEVLDAGYEHAVFDWGQATPVTEDGDQTWLVTRGPCFLALRRINDANMTADGIVLLREEGRALVAKDVEQCLGIPVILELDVDPKVARAVDAGLMIGVTWRKVAEGLLGKVLGGTPA